MAHLFFSYAHADAERMLRFHAILQNISGHYLWIDKEGLRGGDLWEKSIQYAVKTCYGVVFAITETFITRPFILEKEIPWVSERFADLPTPPIFPVLFDKVELPASLAHIQYIDATHDDYERAARELSGRLPEPKEHEGRKHHFIVNWPRLLSFRGRDNLLLDIHGRLKAEGASVGIRGAAGLYGMGGIGKTQLAVEYAHRYRFHYPAGVYWINAAQDWRREFAALADHLGLKPADSADPDREKQMVFAFQNHLREMDDESLLILDNAEQPDEIGQREIAPKLKITDLIHTSRVRLLVTTRKKDLPDGFQPVQVNILSPMDARQVLLDARPSETDIASLDAISKALGYLPLALGLAAATLKKRPNLIPAKLLEHLQAQGIDSIAQKVGAELGTPKEYEARVNVALDWQWRQLERADSPRLMALAAAYGEAAEIPLARLRLLSGLVDDDLDTPFADSIDELTTYNLIEPLDEGRALRLHPLVRQYTRQKVDTGAALAEGAVKLIAALRTPDVFAVEVPTRGYEAVLADLRETRLELQQPNESLNDFEWLLECDRHKYVNIPADIRADVYAVQHLRERAHHQSEDYLRDACDEWLDEQNVPHFRTLDAYRTPVDRALIRLLVGHTQAVTSVVISEDRQLAVSGSADNTVRIWDIDSGRELACFEGHTDSVNAVAISADNRLILSGSSDKTVRAWDVNSRREIACFEGHSDRVNAVAMSADGKLLFSGSDDRMVRIWEINQKYELGSFGGHTGSVKALAVSTDGQVLISASGDKKARVWDVDNAKEIVRFKGHSSYVTGVTLSADNQLAVSSSWDNTIRTWEVSSGRELTRFDGNTVWVSCIAMSTDGQLVVSGSRDKLVRVWEVANGREITHFEGHTGSVSSVAISSDGKLAFPVLPTKQYASGRSTTLFKLITIRRLIMR